MRAWDRSAYFLGNGTIEQQIERELASQWPPEQFPVHIKVVGDQSRKEGIEVPVSNGTDIDVPLKVHPEDFLSPPEGASVAAVISGASQLIAALKDQGKI